MKLKYKLFLMLPALFIAFGFYLKAQNAGEDILLRMVNLSLQSAHYDPVQINDDYSKMSFELYLENIDPNKRLLLQSDVEQLRAFETKIDDQVNAGTYELFDASLSILDERLKQTETYFKEILAEPFDFDKDESVSFDENLAYATSDAALRDRWRTYLKYSVLTRLYADLEAQEKALAKNDTLVEKSFEELEEKARNSVLKTHNDWYHRLNRLERKDRLSVYINSLTAVYDPHTNYFPPADKDNFDIQMSGRLEGIGAQLQEKDGYIKITRIIPGGPSSLQGELKANDLILAVAQENEEAVNIIDWRIDDAVKLIRGKKGTKVTLTVRKPDGDEQDITITRDVVVLEETYAKSLIINDKDNVKAGYVYLPSFYADFRNPYNGRFSWKDVEVELEKLKAENVHGIIIDLRNNGGGSLDDVVKMSGLFIDEGPVVQVKEKGRRAHVMSDTRSGSTWDGPLVIMVNEFSASASEIMAAAMQDYNRAVVIGSAATHGKGTVQRFLPLNQTLRSKNIPDLGSVKLTIQKFYRINGNATQLRGVESDVILPDNYMYLETGEKEHKHPLEWDRIGKASYSDKTYSIPSHVLKNSKKRIASDTSFQLIEENAQRWKKQSERSEYPLAYKQYVNYEDMEEAEGRRFENIAKHPIPNFAVENTELDKLQIENDAARAKRNEEWIKNVRKDLYIYEALQVLEDWK